MLERRRSPGGSRCRLGRAALFCLASGAGLIAVCLLLPWLVAAAGLPSSTPLRSRSSTSDASEVRLPVRRRSHPRSDRSVWSVLHTNTRSSEQYADAMCMQACKAAEDGAGQLHAMAAVRSRRRFIVACSPSPFVCARPLAAARSQSTWCLFDIRCHLLLFICCFPLVSSTLC